MNRFPVAASGALLLVLFAACSLLLAGCGSSSGTSSGPAHPVINSFTASPETRIGDGGVWTFYGQFSSGSFSGPSCATIPPGCTQPYIGTWDFETETCVTQYQCQVR